MTGTTRGQAALEFLLTYGWALLAATVAVGALIYFGATNPAGRLPDKCLFGNGIECTDWFMNRTEARMKIVNTAGQSIYVQYNPNVTDPFLGPCSYSGSPATQWVPDETREIVCNITAAPNLVRGDKGKIKISLYFMKTVDGFNHTSSGELYATVQ